MDNTPELVEGQAVNRAFFALNHYISTGDRVGEGVAMEAGSGAVILLVSFRPREWEDADNWRRLEARLNQLITEKFPLGITKLGTDGEFEFRGVRLPKTELDNLARRLREAPGPLGWGSLYTFLEREGVLGEMIPPP